MKIAITGATGHIASSIIPLLAENKYHIRVLQHTSGNTCNNLYAEVFTGDLCTPSTLTKFTDGCDVVIHCAAKISINSNTDPSVYETNMNGSVNIFNAATKSSVKRFIFVSSIHAYNQNPVSARLDEHRDYCTDKAPLYDRAKRDAQRYVL